MFLPDNTLAGISITTYLLLAIQVVKYTKLYCRLNGSKCQFETTSGNGGAPGSSTAIQNQFRRHTPSPRPINPRSWDFASTHR